MKRIVKKNQIIITALAIMIAVAGYLNYSGSKLDLASTNAGTDGDALALDISSEDQYAQTGLEELVFDDGDIASLDADLEDLESAELTQGETPGEAELSNTPANVG